MFLPYKSAPANTCLTDSESSRERKENPRKPVSSSSSSSATCHSQGKPIKTSRSHTRSYPESTANVETEVALALNRDSPFKGSECNPFLVINSIKCGFSFPDQDECDDEFEIMLPSLNILLRSGRQDPFRQYPVPYLGRYADELMDYG